MDFTRGCQFGFIFERNDVLCPFLGAKTPMVYA